MTPEGETASETTTSRWRREGYCEDSLFVIASEAEQSIPHKACEKRDYFAEETTSLRWQDGESLQAERMSLWDRLEAKIDLAVAPFAGYSELW